MFIYKKKPAESGRKIDHSCRVKKALTLFAQYELPGRERKKIIPNSAYLCAGLVCHGCCHSARVILVEGAGTCQCGCRACLQGFLLLVVVNTELGSRLQWGGLRGEKKENLCQQPVVWRLAAELEMFPQQHCVSVPRAIFLSIVSRWCFICIPQCLIFMARGPFAHWCFQFITLRLQNLSLQAADPVRVRKEGEAHVAGRGSGLCRRWRLHLPFPLSHSSYPPWLCPSLFSNFYFFLFYTPFIAFKSCLSPSLGSTSSASFHASFLGVVISLPPKSSESQDSPPPLFQHSLTVTSYPPALFSSLSFHHLSVIFVEFNAPYF